jgi:hypothetical protein
MYVPVSTHSHTHTHTPPTHTNTQCKLQTTSYSCIKNASHEGHTKYQQVWIMQYIITYGTKCAKQPVRAGRKKYQLSLPYLLAETCIVGTSDNPGVQMDMYIAVTTQLHIDILCSMALSIVLSDC